MIGSEYQIKVRLPLEYGIALKKIAQDHQVSINIEVNHAIYNYIKLKCNQKSLLKKINNTHREIEKMVERSKQRREHRDLFTIQNHRTRIINYQWKYYKTANKFNMPVLERMLRLADQEFKKIPSRSRELLKNELNELHLLQNQTALIKTIKNTYPKEVFAHFAQQNRLEDLQTITSDWYDAQIKKLSDGENKT